MPNERIKIESEEDMIKIAKEGYHILRMYTEAVCKWRKEYGSINRMNMDYWQSQSIEFLKDPIVYVRRYKMNELKYEPIENKTA